jgi:predicted metal-dependent hydrolase
MKVIFRSGIGEIVLLKKAGIKNFSIKVKPFDGVILTMPIMATFEQAEAIIDKRIDWIKKSVQKIEKIEEKKTIFLENTPFSTRNHRLHIINVDRNNVKVSIKNGLILIQKPKLISTRDEFIQQAVRKGITEAFRLEAKLYLPGRLAFFCQKFNLSFNNLAIKDITSRWGSCSATNNINISLYVMQLPDYLIDYVLLHELSHTKIKSHKAPFWEFLDVLTQGNARKWDNEINQYSTKFF